MRNNITQTEQKQDRQNNRYRTAETGETIEHKQERQYNRKRTDNRTETGQTALDYLLLHIPLTAIINNTGLIACCVYSKFFDVSAFR
jgi:hypothetical protein